MWWAFGISDGSFSNGQSASQFGLPGQPFGSSMSYRLLSHGFLSYHGFSTLTTPPSAYLTGVGGWSPRPGVPDPGGVSFPEDEISKKLEVIRVAGHP